VFTIRKDILGWQSCIPQITFSQKAKSEYSQKKREKAEREMYFLSQKKKKESRESRKYREANRIISRRHSATNQRAARTKYRRERGVSRLPSGSP
jgi:hypothetical protein